MLRPALLYAVLAAAIAMHPAQAAEHGGRMEQSFSKADRNGDGVLDREEAKAMPRVAENFDAIDGDKDGTVSREELRETMKSRMKNRREAGKEHFAAADKNSDGVLDREEAKAMPRVAKNFDAIDQDGNGTVSRDELRQSMMQHRKDMHERGRERFAAADRNSDGVLDSEEARAMPKVAENFEAIDVDHDGTVTEREIHNFMRARRE